MSKTLAVAILISSLLAIVVISVCNPGILDDTNSFLQKFVGTEILNVLGVILAITLASASQIHLKFNEMEERRGERFLIKSREEVGSIVHWLIGLFVLAVVLAFVKPYTSGHRGWESFVNGMALWTMLFNILILIDITKSVFKIPPHIKD